MTFDLFTARSSLLLYAFVWAPYICLEKKLIISNDFSSEASGPVLLKFYADPPWAGEGKIAKMGMVHWSRWLPCPYMVKTLKNLLLEKQISPGPKSLHKLWGTGDLPKLLKWWFCVDIWPFLPPRSNLLTHAFVWAIYIYIESIEMTCRSTVVKIVLIGNLRWPSSCLYLLYFPATVLFTCIKSWFFRNHLANFPNFTLILLLWWLDWKNIA